MVNVMLYRQPREIQVSAMNSTLLISLPSQRRFSDCCVRTASCPPALKVDWNDPFRKLIIRILRIVDYVPASSHPSLWWAVSVPSIRSVHSETKQQMHQGRGWETAMPTRSRSATIWTMQGISAVYLALILARNVGQQLAASTHRHGTPPRHQHIRARRVSYYQRTLAFKSGLSGQSSGQSTPRHLSSRTILGQRGGIEIPMGRFIRGNLRRGRDTTFVFQC